MLQRSSEHDQAQHAMQTFIRDKANRWVQSTCDSCGLNATLVAELQQAVEQLLAQVTIAAR